MSGIFLRFRFKTNFIVSGFVYVHDPRWGEDVESLNPEHKLKGKSQTHFKQNIESLS